MSTNLTLYIFAIWLVLISAVVAWIFNYFRKLSKQVKKGNLLKILDKVLDTEIKNSKDIKKLKKEITRIEKENLSDIQKIGLVRFNPFEELGGDHSFTLALLDGYDNGVIITGLHTRDRTRVYIKEVFEGKTKYKLSKEEKEALTKAKNSK